MNNLAFRINAVAFVHVYPVTARGPLRSRVAYPVVLKGLAAGHSTGTYIRAMEALAPKTGLLPERSWDEADRPDIHMWLGKPTGSAMPLMWARRVHQARLRNDENHIVMIICLSTIFLVLVLVLIQKPKRR